jgi:ATP-dependent Clp protease ATP-binding subunit ClpA
MGLRLDGPGLKGDPLLADLRRTVLSHATQEANDPGHPDLTPEHLVLGLMRAADSEACRVLGESGVTLEGVRLLLLAKLDGTEKDK